MKVKDLKKVSNKYSVIQQVYEDRVLIRTDNIIYSSKYNSYMFLLSNNSCIWTREVVKIYFGKTQFENVSSAHLVQIKPEDFERIKTYEKPFNNFYFEKEDEITCYDDLIKIAKEQAALNLVTKFSEWKV